jgi:multimeric flavodoxin WrbA
MLVLGLQGSPRKKGNTHFLLQTFMDEAQNRGATTRIIDVDKKHITPCKEYIVCEKKGFCPIDDDMKHEIYPLLREADAVVAASPIFFYNVTAQLKALIDRSQTLWARKYRLQLNDPFRSYRRGFLLAVGATKGANLFEGVNMTAKYFFDAIGASFEGSLAYRKIEHPGDMEKHPTVHEDIKRSVEMLLKPFMGRKKIMFACRENACRSQMAAAFAQHLGGDKIDALSAGTQPAEVVNPTMVKVVQEKGIDMAFRRTRLINDAVSDWQPEIIVTMGCGEECPSIPGAKVIDWDLPDPAEKPPEVMRTVRDEIEKRVVKLISEL